MSGVVLCGCVSVVVLCERVLGCRVSGVVVVQCRGSGVVVLVPRW